jgi:hypothetical protein
LDREDKGGFINYDDRPSLQKIIRWCKFRILKINDNRNFVTRTDLEILCDPPPPNLHETSLLKPTPVKGLYVPFSCGASCSDGKIVWDSNGFHYTLGFKAAYLKSLVSLANEIIDNIE